jgi:nucleoside-diphosphate-sugar epimerase
MIKLFVTGGTGFIGRAFIKEAIKKNYFVYAVTRKKKNNNNNNLKWLHGSIDSNWLKELQQSDILVHFASAGVINKNISFIDAFQTNVLESYQLLMTAIKANCKKWIIIGSCYENIFENKKKLSLNKNKYFNYAFSKFMFSKLSLLLSKKFKCKCRVLRLFHVYGAGENKNRMWPLLIKAAKSGKNFKMSKGNQKRDFININETIKIILDTLNFKKNCNFFPQLWHVGSGRNVSVKKFVNYFWKNEKARGKIFFNKIKNYDPSNYVSKKKLLWRL